jgi:hypothetical protein
MITREQYSLIYDICGGIGVDLFGYISYQHGGYIRYENRTTSHIVKYIPIKLS